MEMHALLSHEETSELLEKARAGDRSAVECIVIHNQRLAYKIANRYYLTGFCGDLELDDIVQWANIGLLRAIKKYNPNTGLRFSTYATHWINGTIRRNARGDLAVKLSFRDGIQVSKIRGAMHRLVQAYGTETPDPKQIAEATGIPESLVVELLPVMLHDISLDTAWDEDSPNVYESRKVELSDAWIPEEPDSDVDTGELQKLVDKLPDTHREIIILRYLTRPPGSASEVGRTLGIPYQQVAIIEKDAIGMLRRMHTNLNSGG